MTPLPLFLIDPETSSCSVPGRACFLGTEQTTTRPHTVLPGAAEDEL